MTMVGTIKRVEGMLPLISLKQVEQFRALQGALRDRHWHSVDLFNLDNQDLLVIPSVSLDQRELDKVQGIVHYEERLLYSLIRLKSPRTRLIYVTSQRLPEITIEYYLQLLPGIPLSHARERLLLLSVDDHSRKSLTQKILERPRIMERIHQALRPGQSYMICFNSTTWERELSLRLGIPLFAVDPDLLYWGTKSGSRKIFAECNIPHPDGSLEIRDAKDLALVTAELWERQPHLKRMVVKLNEGFSGEGNAILDLRPLADFAPHTASHTERVNALWKSFPQLEFQAANETWDNFSSRIPELGAIVEAFIEGEEKRSPSVQCCIFPDGKVDVFSTHDQILGGAHGQIYLGCRFPADMPYRLQLQELGKRVGENLAAKGALERFSVDFMAVRRPENPDIWDLQAIEINLRKGGTTHPFMTLRYLTGGHYNEQDGLFYTLQGQPKYYVATDNLQKPQYRGLLPRDLMDIIAHNQLLFDRTSTKGSVFHLMGSLSEFGKLGLTSIGNSWQEAQDLYDQVVAVLDRETCLSQQSSWCMPQTLPLNWHV